MYGFIRGSHLFVRCPKWTPLSSRAFIGITAIFSPNVYRSPARGARAPEWNGTSLVGIRLYEPDPLRDAYCPSQAGYVPACLRWEAARLYHRNHKDLCRQAR